MLEMAFDATSGLKKPAVQWFDFISHQGKQETSILVFSGVIWRVLIQTQKTNVKTGRYFVKDKGKSFWRFLGKLTGASTAKTYWLFQDYI